LKCILEKSMWSKSCLEEPGTHLEQFLFYQHQRVRYVAWLSIQYWSMKIAKGGILWWNGSSQRYCQRSTG
jgi:hypothetical protein